MPRSRRLTAMAVLAIVVAASLITLADDSRAEPTPWQLPRWEEGFTWSYEVDQDVDMDILGFVHVDHIKANLTRTVYKVLTVGEETHYQVWDEQRGRFSGSFQYGIFNIDADLDMIGSGWSYWRASDLALINQSQNMTFTADDIPFVGSFTGGMDNLTVYDPPVPMMRFPTSSSPWQVQTTANSTTEFFVLYPIQDSSWINSSDVWDLTATPSGPADHTVPAGTYPAISVNEVGTITTNGTPRDVDRTWYYGNEVANLVETWDGYRLVYTDAHNIPPNGPPVGPVEPVELGMDEDVPLPIEPGQYFTDPDEDVLTFGLRLDGPSQANASLTGGGDSWTLTPAADWSGKLHLVATARDPSQNEATGEISVTVRPVNDPPHVAEAPFDLVTDEDTPTRTPFDLGDIFDDVDGDELVFSAAATPGVQAVLNGTFVDLIPDPDWTGISVIDLSARDPDEAFANASFSLMVGSVNDAPTIVASGGPARVHEVEEGTFWVEAVDLDSDHLTSTWFLESISLAGVDGPEYTFAPGDLTVDSVTLSVTVEDDWGDEDSVEWTVIILDAPWIISTSPPSIVNAMVGDTVSFTVEVEDADTPEPTHTWTWRGVLVGTGDELHLVLGIDDVGEGKVRIEVTDGVGVAFHEWDLIVTVPNEPPSVVMDSPLDGSKWSEGKAIPLRALVDDEDVEGLSIRWFVDGSPIGTGAEGEYISNRVGSLIIQVMVSDGVLSVTESASIQVTAAKDQEGGDVISDDNTMLILILVVAAIIVILFMILRAGGEKEMEEPKAPEE